MKSTTLPKHNLASIFAVGAAAGLAYILLNDWLYQLWRTPCGFESPAVVCTPQAAAMSTAVGAIAGLVIAYVGLRRLQVRWPESQIIIGAIAAWPVFLLLSVLDDMSAIVADVPVPDLIGIVLSFGVTFGLGLVAANWYLERYAKLGQFRATAWGVAVVVGASVVVGVVSGVMDSVLY